MSIQEGKKGKKNLRDLRKNLGKIRKIKGKSYEIVRDKSLKLRKGIWERDIVMATRGEKKEREESG